MSTSNERAADLIKEAASEFIQRESNRNSMITVTNTAFSTDFKKVSIFVTVFPEQQEVAAIDFLKRNRRDFKEYLKSHTRLKRIPLVDFDLDQGEKSRQRLDEISSEI